MAVADSHGIPIAIHAGSASPHEVTLVEETLEQNLLSNAPERLIGDGAYDSNPLDERLEERGIEMIAPHRKNRVAPACPNRFYALKTLSTSPVEEYDYVQIATSTSCVHCWTGVARAP
jgi:hypothetical protein